MKIKKSIIFLAVIGVVLAVLCSCSVQSSKSNFEKVMSLPGTIADEAYDAYIFADLNDYEKYCRDRNLDYSFLKGKVVKTEYHVCFDKEDMLFRGYTLVTFSVEKSTGSLLKKGDVITLGQDSYVQFKNDADAYRYLTGKTAESPEEMNSELGKTDDIDKVLVFQDGVEYIRRTRGFEVPMKEGETYTMAAYKLDGKDTCGYNFALPGDSLVSEFRDRYGTPFPESYYSIANEIRSKIKNLDF